MQILGEHINIKSARNFSYLVHVLMLSAVAAGLLFGILTQQVSAADFTQRSLRVTTSTVNEIGDETLAFNYSSPLSVGSIVFEYCSNSPLISVACVAPAGLDVSGVTLSSQNGVTGFSIHANTTTNRLVLTRAPAVVVPGSATYQLANVVNPSSTGTVYVRLTSHASIDGTGAVIDSGATAFSIVNQLTVNAYVPPYLTFCVAITITGDCAATSGDVVNMGNLSTLSANTATTQFAGATNDVTGYSVYVVGSTMTAGSHVIPAMSTAQASAVGTSQFGINLRLNTVPTVGAEPAGVGTLTPQGDYANPNTFKFATGDLIASSPLTTDFNTFTVSYLVNISSGQAPGVYATTLSYIAIASF